jgi:hypothetical protein
MKKIVLSLAGVLAATAFAPEAMALPAFARQTGMACTACHFQHFPVLNSFGRAFRASGYTMVGSQGKVEGEHLSIPDTLNASLLLKARYQKTSGSDAAGAISGVTANGGQWQLPDEFAIIFGGRIGENVGFMAEVAGNGAPNANTNANSPTLGGLKMPFIYDIGAAKIGVTPFLTDSQGASYGYEQASGGQVRASRWSEDRNATSAHNFVGIASGAATGLAFSASNDMGYVALTRFTPNHTMNQGLNGGVQMKSNLLRIAATPTVGDWTMLVGGSFYSGSNYVAVAAAPVAANLRETKATALDLQAQGQLGGKDISFYANYAKVPGSAVGATANLWNAAVTDEKAFVIAADYSVIPHVLSLAASYRSANDGGAVGVPDKNNAVTLQAVYDLYQNVALHAVHTMQSGSAYGVTGTRAANMLAGGAGKNLTTLMLEVAW